MSSFFKTDQLHDLCPTSFLTLTFLFGRNTWLYLNWLYFTFLKATSTMHTIQQECESPVCSVLSFSYVVDASCSAVLMGYKLTSFTFLFSLYCITPVYASNKRSCDAQFIRHAFLFFDGIQHQILQLY
jgi:hypothetical protein